MYYLKSKRLSDKTINSIKTPDYWITPYLIYYDFNKIRVKFDGDCLKKDQAAILYGGTVNVYIVYEIKKKHQHQRLSNSRKLFIWSC